MLCDFAARSETAVKGPISIVASQRKIIPPSNGGTTHGNDLAVWLNQQGLGLIRSPSKVSRYLAPRTEASVEVSVCFIAGEAKIATPPASHHDSSVGLNGYACSGIKIEQEFCGDFAACAKSRIERAVCVIAGQGEFGRARGLRKASEYGPRCTRRHQAAICLQRDGKGFIPAAEEVGRDLAARAK